jgi:dTDP-4-amino-4,6-dideoxygalactose transaminase
MEALKLFDPPRLRGTYLAGVLRSKHLTTGPGVEALRCALAREFKVTSDRIVLGSSATVCGFVLMEFLKRKHGDIRIEFGGLATWPLFYRYAYRQGFTSVSLRPEAISWWTDIGGRPETRTVYTAGKEVVVDACHSCSYDSSVPWIDFTLMSFYPTKLLAGAEGGLIICEDPQEAMELQQILDCGFDKQSWEDMRHSGRSWDAGAIHPLAVKGNMSDVQAAFGLEALENFDLQKRKTTTAWAALHIAITSKFPELDKKVVKQRDMYLFQIRVKDVERARKWFLEQGLPTAWNFPPARLVTIPCHYTSPPIVERIAGLVIGYYRFERETSK